MTEQEIINNRLETRIEIQDEKFNSVMSRIDITNQRIDDFISEMRNRDNQRHAEMSEIRTLIDSTNKYVRNLTFTAIGAIAAMVIAVLLK